MRQGYFERKMYTERLRSDAKSLTSSYDENTSDSTISDLPQIRCIKMTTKESIPKNTQGKRFCSRCFAEVIDPPIILLSDLPHISCSKMTTREYIKEKTQDKRLCSPCFAEVNNPSTISLSNLPHMGCSNMTSREFIEDKTRGKRFCNRSFSEVNEPLSKKTYLACDKDNQDTFSAASNKLNSRNQSPVYSKALIVKYGQPAELEGNSQDTRGLTNVPSRYESYIECPVLKIERTSYNLKTDDSSAVFEGRFPLADTHQMVVQYNSCPDNNAPVCPPSPCSTLLYVQPAPAVSTAHVSDPCSSVSINTEAHCPAYDYLTFNQFQEFCELFKLPCKGIKGFFQFIFLLILTMLYFYFAFLLFHLLIEKLKIGFLGFEIQFSEKNSEAVTTTTTTTDRKFWQVIRPKANDLWRQCF